MNFLIIDGNSILNRAYYGIKLLTASDGHPTNALFGFMNILLNLTEKVSPDAVAVAFDVHEPTFRHKMYDGYKAGRHPTPPELLQQMEPAKELLRAYGCTVIECPGFEADDILGTLSRKTGEGVHTYISTGDRDSLQLVTEDVSVLLVTTKLGKTDTQEFTPALLKETYGVSPSGMIEIKALQGDSSDNIKGVAGIGPKTAGELISQYGSIDYIYEHIDEVKVTAKTKEKLLADRESAFFSRILGTISLEAPIPDTFETCLKAQRNEAELFRLLSYHEMTKLIAKLGLKAGAAAPAQTADTAEDVSVNKDIYNNDIKYFESINKKVSVACTISDGRLNALALSSGGSVCEFTHMDEQIEDAFLKILADGSIAKFTNGIKPLYKWAMSRGGDVCGAISDAELQAYLIDASKNEYSTETLCTLNSVFATLPEGASQSVLDAARLEALCDKLSAKLKSYGQTKLYSEIELPLARVLARMEMAGMAVDRQGIEAFSEKLATDISGLEKKIHDAAGEKFNINSPKQLGVILFEKLGLPAKKKTKTGYSTGAELLEELAEQYPIVSDILKYRELSKLRSTYCEGLLKTIEADGRIRSTFTQTETRTGRLSSVEPNLQNIPVRTPLGREMRKFFVADEGNCLIDADYSQIELRVLASLADDKNMLDAFNSGVDVHTLTAAKVFGLPENEVTSSLRSKAKAVNFGIVYGIGAFSLAKDIGTSRKEAESFINSYLALYSSVDAFLKKSVEDAKEKKYAETYFGRRRYLPEISSSNHMIKAFGERVAKNAPIQGTAADIIKIAMIKVDERLAREYPEAKLIMQVHDELIIEAPEAQSEAVGKLLCEEMVNAVHLSAEMSVEVGIGGSWYSAKG